MLAVLGACGGGEPPPKTVDKDAAFEAAVAAERAQDAKREARAAPRAPARPKGAVAAAPFSWQQIRAATKNGRNYHYRVEVSGKPSKEHVLRFTKVDDSGAEIATSGDAPRRVGWPALQQDAEFPKDKLTVREESIKLPSGKFDCVVYEVRGAEGETSTYFFAKSLPGAPVLFYTEQGGRRIKTTTLLRHVPGSDS
jgi:hypothetical protein